MKKTIKIIILIALVSTLTNCNGQIKSKSTATAEKLNTKAIVGGGCDGCELMFISIPKNITAVDTSLGWYEEGQKLVIKGKVYQRDGKTPATNVIIYYWQTDAEGYYSPIDGMDEKALWHGHLRGWMKTDANGNYTLYTLRPAPYPKTDMPAHIHLSIKEPNISDEYYTDEITFDDDLLLTQEKRITLENRCGSGILKVQVKNNIQWAEHTIILGLNIPNYPESALMDK